MKTEASQKLNLLSKYRAVIIFGFAFIFCCQHQYHADAMFQQAQRYELKGTIKSVNKGQKTAVIRHEKVGDYMEPMTMPFFIKDEQALQQLEPRDQIVATLVISKKSGEWLENIIVVAKGR